MVCTLPLAADSCIETPDGWVQHWNNSQWKCVDPSLFATIVFPGEGKLADTYIYPCSGQANPCNDGFRYAWALSNTNLELALALRQKYGDDTTKLSSAIFSLVGFTGVEQFKNTSVVLAVYTLPGEEQAIVPTWEAWFRLLDELAAETDSLQHFRSSENIQARFLRSQQALFNSYSTIPGHPAKAGQRPQDVVDVFATLSGCPRTATLFAPTADGSGTDPEYHGLGVAPQDPTAENAWKPFDQLCDGPVYDNYKKFLTEGQLISPYTVSADSRTCFINGLKYLQSNPEMISEVTLRAMLAQCQDANQLNTGAGFGYNTYPNPTSYGDECGFYWDPKVRTGEQTVLQRLTGREFILLNRQLKNYGSYSSVTLEFSDEEPRPYLVHGYCSSK